MQPSGSDAGPAPALRCAGGAVDGEMRCTRDSSPLCALLGVRDSLVGRALRDVSPALAAALEPLVRGRLEGEPGADAAAAMLPEGALGPDSGAVVLLVGRAEGTDGGTGFPFQLVALPPEEPEARYLSLFEQTREAVALYDGQGRFLRANRAMCRLLGVDRAEALLGRSVLNMLEPADRDIARDRLRQVLESGRVDDTTVSLRRADGTKVRVEVQSTRVVHAGRVAIQAVARDLTDRLSAARQLSRSAELDRALAHHFPNGAVLVFDRELRCLLADGPSMRELGWLPENLEGRPLGDHLGSGLADVVGSHFRAALAGESHIFDLEFGDRPFLGQTVPLRQEDGELFAGMFVVQDVSRTRRAEQALRESETRLRTILQSMADFVLTWDTELRLVGYYGAEERRELLDLSRGLSRRPPEIFGAQGEVYEQMGRRALAGEDVLYDWTFGDRHGASMELQTRLSPIRDGHGRVTGVLSVSRDVTGYRQAEQALRESEARLRAIFETGGVGVCISTADGVLLETNAALEQMAGLTKQEMRGRCIAELTHPDDRADDETRLARLGSGEIARDRLEKRIVRPDGSVACLAVARTFIPAERTGTAPAILSIVEDVTARKQLEVQFRQSQKMEAVGRLAGGIAHDFNNLITAIGGHTALALDALPSSHPAREELLEVERAAGRASALTRQLLAFSRHQVLQPRVLDLNAAIRDLERMLRRLIGEHIELVTALAAAPVFVRADPSQIEQVVINLAVNAGDAMPDGGRLTLSTEALPARPAHDAGDDGGPLVRLTVRDTGAGIPADDLNHIFEPFFTTKGEGRGTGLGLSTVYGIVEQSGGSIGVDSQPGAGTAFTIDLPAVAEEPGGATGDAAVGEHASAADGEAHAAPPAAPRASRVVVLVVEDEPGVRSLVRRVLQDRGFAVLEAANADDAMAIFDAAEPPVDLLVTDVVMPGLPGPALANALRQRRPDLPVVLMSGYAEQRHLDSPLARTLPFLEKPFTADALDAMVRAALDQGASG